MNYKYPHFGKIEQVLPNPEIMLGHDIYWTLKVDGSNSGFYFNEKGELRIRSRNMEQANFFDKIMNIDVSNNIVEMMEFHKEKYNKDYVVFGELLSKGKSPTGLKTYDKDDYVVFDIYDHENDSFLNFNQMCLFCGSFDIPVVDLIGKCNVNTKESLFAFRDEMLEETKGEEGVVGKIYKKPFDFHSENFLFVKEKHFLQRPRRERKSEGKIMLPQLNIGEIRKCIAKVYDESTLNEFKDIRIIMPRIAQEVKLECNQQNCSNNINLFKFYQEKLKEIVL